LKENSRGTEPFLNLPLSTLHTNFKIKSSGEEILLSTNNGQEADRFPADSIPGDISKGRYPDGSSEWYFFNGPTPGEPNSSNGYRNFSPGVSASMSSGFYTGPIAVDLIPDEASCPVYFTLDGSIPDLSSSKYTQPLLVTSSTVLRARAIEDVAMPGKVLTQTYLINENSRLPVISMSTDPENLWDNEDGIYIMGDNAEQNNPYFGANFWEDWEKAAHIEFFEDDGSPAFSTACGIKIFGGWSRAFPQKSFSIFFRGNYGLSELEYPVFPQLDVQNFEALILRNSGNDWLNTNMRDGMMQSLLSNTDIDKQAFRPVVLFLNGQYWGIYNLREKVNEHFISSHHGVDVNNIDMLEGQHDVLHGDNEHYINILDFINNNDMTSEESYSFIQQNIDLKEYFDYVVAQIYFDNTDWPGNNIKYWRPKTPDGKWRWILFDTDFGFGLYDHEGFKHNTLEFALDDAGPEWPNPPWSTLLLRKILKNKKLKQQCINYFADHLNTTFGKERVERTINILKANMEIEMEKHLERWQGDLSH
ncbi:MAG: CotH kinase family protein, partial [Thermodesulfovibrionia bacterium]|nr:CotH kinase family protein [Thermodesulfovibrionia bacterium]